MAATLPAQTRIPPTSWRSAPPIPTRYRTTRSNYSGAIGTSNSVINSNQPCSRKRKPVSARGSAWLWVQTTRSTTAIAASLRNNRLIWNATARVQKRLLGFWKHSPNNLIRIRTRMCAECPHRLEQLRLRCPEPLLAGYNNVAWDGTYAAAAIGRASSASYATVVGTYNYAVRA